MHNSFELCIFFCTFTNIFKFHIMIDRVISFETAILAKEKGFPQIRLDDVKNHYNEHGNLNGTILFAKQYIKDNKLSGKSCFMNSYVAPTQSLLQKWIRENYGIDLWVEKYPNDKIYHPQCPMRDNPNGIGYFHTYEDALEAVLVIALNLIKI